MSRNAVETSGISNIDCSITEEEARRRPSIRSLTIRFILALFKYLHEGGKIDILKNKPLCNALFQHLRDDPADLINELLTTIEQSVLKDAEIPRSAKQAVLSIQNLERVTEIATRSEEGHAASQKAFGWLKAVSTTTQYGLLRDSGWYPPGTASSDTTRSSIFVDLGLDSLEFYDSEEPLNVRNTTLLSWAMSLRAQTDERERELLITCFTSAPELVAAYFADKTMPMEPRLTNTWIGYASLLFEIVRLPVPENFGPEDGKASLPAQTTIMIENILPRPLTQKVLVRCLNQGNDLITFFAIRLLVLAFQKLDSVLEEMRPQSTDDRLWKESAEKLQQRFVERCPSMKDVIAVFRKIPDDFEHSLQREATTRLLRLYYELSPLQALEEQFDVSSTLTAALIGSEVPTERVPAELQALKKLELEHLLAISRHSTGMRWFHKQGGLTYTPIVTLLRIHCKDLMNRQVRSLIQHVLTTENVLHEGASHLDALLASLVGLLDDSSAWELVDDCIGRATRKPVKYLDDLNGIIKKLGLNQDNAHRSSLLIAVVLEQAPFVASKMDAGGKAKAEWVEGFLALPHSEGKDDEAILADVLKSVRSLPGWKTSKLKDVVRDMESVRLPIETPKQTKASTTTAANGDSALNFQPPLPEPQSHPEITRWSLKEIDMAIEDGDVSALILCLCSQHSDIRKQGFAQLNKIKLQLHTSSLENSAQLALLLGEITETFEQQYYKPDIALPYIAGTFGVRAVQVLTEPSHHIYPKMNRYLIRGPEWRVNKMPNYWLSNTVLALPEDDDGYWKEVQWVLDWLVDGLRTPADLDVLRRGDVFEKAMALWTSPGAASHKFIRERALELLFRATCVEGGSNVLVTRSGVLSWLESIAITEGDVAKKLKERVLETCDAGRFEAWAKGETKRKEEAL